VKATGKNARPPGPPATRERIIRPLETEFVKRIILGDCGADAVRVVWPSVAHPSNKASELMKRPWIASEIERQRDLVRKHTVYEVKDAMRELDEAIDFAKAANSAMALTRCLELRAKLHGLLVEKVQVEHTTLNLKDAMDQGLQRVSKRRPDISDAEIVEVTPRPAPERMQREPVAIDAELIEAEPSLADMLD
jgi:hypothetical protein